MSTVAKPVLPVTLKIGDIAAAEVGTVEIPLVTGPASKDAAGRWRMELRVDHPALRRNIAILLRGVADELEGLADDE
ncbi:hypothetical protein AB0L05_27725 [Nonomuraea pusilla]|uniref:hypothetical protein n=1 Tax=Nonomuraea pusilla TaxID=46177 RepID=UPI00331952BF